MWIKCVFGDYRKIESDKANCDLRLIYAKRNVKIKKVTIWILNF